MVLLPPPVPETAEEVVGEEAADGVPDYVDVDGLLDPEPFRGGRKTNDQSCGRRAPPAPRPRRPSPGEVQEVDVPRVEERLRDPADVPHEIYLQNQN